MKYPEFGEDKFEEEWNSSYSLVPDKEVEESWEMFKNRLRLRNKKRRVRLFSNLGLAAAMLILLIVSYFFAEACNSTVTVDNFSQVDKEVTLPDGTLVLLKRGSEMQYKEKFQKVRSVKLRGEAFFNVVKDNSKEFKVSTRSTTTTVFGTSFSVVQKEGSDDVKISLYTGQVKVSSKFSFGSWFLAPGQSLEYIKGQGKIRNFNPNLSFKSGNEYIDATNLKLEELFYFLEQRFGYNFIRNTYTGNKIVTLRINKKDSLEQILKILSIINNATYEINEDKKEVQIVKK